jgi:hypothetical protein
MRTTKFVKLCFVLGGTIGLLMMPSFGRCQEAAPPASSSPSNEGTSTDTQALVRAVRELQGQVQTLQSQVIELRSEQQHSQQEAATLRHELHLSRAQTPLFTSASYRVPSAELAPESASMTPLGTSDRDDESEIIAVQQANAKRLDKIEEDQDLIEGKLNDQYQTKVESASKYKLRLSGIVLFNAFSNRGVVDNQDFPGLAFERHANQSGATFGGSLRQTQIGIQSFGPDIAGAHTTADVNFDFAGGFPDTPNGVATGFVRLRTGTVRLDWADTSIIAGQDHLFFAPLAPTSMASLAVPALSYSGNLWGWVPQVRVEHRIHVSEGSTLLLQGGILDSFTGQLPSDDYHRAPGAGESSGQPAYATRVAWSHGFFGHEMTAGFGGYYARQNWAFGRNVDGWAGTTDLTLPFGRKFAFTGEFYRGRALGGIGGGIYQTVMVSGPLSDPASLVQGLNSMGGWAQLKFKPVPKFEVNGAFGHDNPFGNQIARFASVPLYYDTLFARNQSWFTNFIYQPRSDVLLSFEFRRLRTFGPDGGADRANHLNFGLGYLF